MPGDKQAAGTAADRAAAAFDAASRVVVLTGAGISTDSGIPDFRGPQGVWTKSPEAERTSTLQHYLGDPAVRRRVWQGRLHSPVWTAQPNPGHLALVELERQGRLVAIVTQNIDEMHQKAGSDPDRVIELHGTMHHVTCWTCGLRSPIGPVLARLAGGDEDPACQAPANGGTCGGILKAATISFGQSLDPAVIQVATEAVLEADLLVAVGSKLSVYPAAGLVPLAAAEGIGVVIVNADPTPYDDLAVAVVRQPISEMLPRLVGPRAGTSGPDR
jgi:NAD-dependent deacetylase